MQLSDYRLNVRDLLHDPNANFYSVSQVDRWINRARLQVAEKGRCVRRLTPGSGSVSGLTVTGSGAGYTSATVEIGAPDSNEITAVQATATATVAGGQITSFTVTNAGSGYVAPPEITITGDGTGGMATAVLTPHATTVPDQEIYPVADLAEVLGDLEPGLGVILGIQSITVSWGSVRPMLAWRDFTWLQAYARASSMRYQNYPAYWAQYGQGATGSLYLWPISSQYCAMEADCYFSVQDLSEAQTVDLIPAPWAEPVYYYAAHLAFRNAQRPDDAREMLAEHNRLMVQARASVSPDRMPDPYGEG